jgi:hypothetical protein
MTADTTTETNALQAAAPTEAGALALITLKPEQYAAEVYQPFRDRLTKAIESVRAIDYDITTTKGMDAAKGARRLVADIRIEANKERLARKAPITQIGKLLESTYDAVEARILPLESLFDDDIKAEEKRKEEMKKEKERAEAARVQAIADRISAIGKLALKTARMSSAQISEVMAELAAIKIDDSFAEFFPNARVAWDDTHDALFQAHKAASDAEAEAEAKRQEAENEARKVAKERAELEAQRKENERVQNELAAERKRIADEAAAQEAIAAEQRRKAQENAVAEAAAQTKRLQEEADERARLHALEMKKLADERAAFEAEQQAAREKVAAEQKAVEDAAKLEADHAEGLEMNQAFDDEMIRRSDEGIPVTTYRPPQEDITDLAESIEATEPTDSEIVAAYIEHFGGTPGKAIERLSRFAASLAA